MLGRDQQWNSRQGTKICRKANLKLNKDKCHFRCTSFHSYGEVLSWHSYRKLKILMDMPSFICTKELQSLQGMIKYLSKFLPATAEVFQLLRKLASVKADWSWDGTYYDLYDKAKRLITMDACMKFYDTSKPFYIETDASGTGLGASLLQMSEDVNCRHDEVMDICPIAFARKILSSMEWWYSDIEMEKPSILQWHKKFHHYCITKDVHFITDYKPLVAMISKDVATLSQQLQCIMLCVHQYSVCILQTW